MVGLLRALLTAFLSCDGAFAYVLQRHSEYKSPNAVVPNVQNELMQSFGSASDPVTSLVIQYPQHGAMERPPVKLAVAIHVRAGGYESFSEMYDRMGICVDINNATFACSPVNERWAELQLWKFGTYTAQAYFTKITSDNAPIGKRFWQTPPSTFDVVSDADLAAHKADLVQQRETKYRVGYNFSLTDWASQQQQERPAQLLERLGQDSIEGDDNLILLIGVKTAIASNFAHRQAIRETWASKEVLPEGVKVVFIGCRPFSHVELVTEENSASTSGDIQRRRLREAIELERMVYGDLLTDELDCNDAYIDLANKVKEFLHVAATQYSRAQFVMIADDDLYVRTDKLVKTFEQLGPQRRYYSGQVPSIQHARKDKPIRTPGSRCSLSEEQYPLSELPPMAMGAYFFLSMDCVEFVSKNRRRLRDLGGMDDITVPLWMLAIQVHVQEFPRGLGFLRSIPCENTFVAFGDLSPLAIHEVHSNILEQRPFCHGFDRNLWLKSSEHKPPNGISLPLPRFSEALEFGFAIQNTRKLGSIQITTIISSLVESNIKVTYFPSNETFVSYSRRVWAESRLQFPSAVADVSCHDFYIQLREKLQEFYEQVEASGLVNLSRLALWKHNLSKNGSAIIIAYSMGVESSSCMFASLFTSMNLTRPMLFIDEFSLHRRFLGVQPDVFIFSILDGDCQYYLRPGCQSKIADYLTRYYHAPSLKPTNATEKPCSVMMFSGEAWSVEGLDERVLLVSTVADLPREKHIYLSMASASFAERTDHDPPVLLAPLGERHLFHTRKFCAYMYARCDRLKREFMFDVLNEMEPVDALGRCSGRSKVHTSPGNRPERYNDDAVERYKNYKFVIAFENSQAPGYVTEKIVNAFLAGSIPIYYGNSTTVSQLFNPKSFIDCGAFSSLQECAHYVLQVHTSPEVYSRMLQEPPITNVQAFERAFSWHPAVPSDHHVKQIEEQGWIPTTIGFTTEHDHSIAVTLLDKYRSQ